MIGTELHRLHDDGVSEEELERARENVKGRTVLSMESTLTRMNRLGSSVLMGVPLLTVDEVLAAFDAVTLDDVTALAHELFAPERMSAAGVGGDETAFRARARGREPGARRGVINVARLRRRGADGADRLRRGRGRRGHGARRPRRPALDDRARGRARRRRRGRGLLDPRHAPSTTRASASKPACTA